MTKFTANVIEDENGEQLLVFPEGCLPEDWGLRRAKWWELKLCWLPKKCYLTGKPLWGRRAYRGERWFRFGQEFVVEHFWIDKHEFLIWTLKKKE